MKPASPWRRHWKLGVGFPLVLALLVVAFGDRRVRAFSSSDRDLPDAPVQQVGTEAVALFDPGRVHRMDVRWDADDYDRMRRAYLRDGERQWVEADLVIDGVAVPSVGLRLRGSTPLTAADLDAPERLGWLVSFDEYARDRAYQGNAALDLRTSSGQPATVVNEALALSVVADAGEPSPGFAWTTLSVNGAAPVLRLAVQEPGEQFTDEDLEHDGPLYKALDTGHLQYRGEDPLAYADDVEQLTNRRRQDLQYWIDLAHWVTVSSDVAFDRQLADRVDMASFARYLALQHLLANPDDMAGPGQNYLLFFDLVTERFRVLAWDLDRALTGDLAAGPLEPLATIDAASAAAGLGGNDLKERFLGSSVLRPAYVDAYRELYDRYLAGGRARALLAELGTVLGTVDPTVAAPATVAAEVARVRAAIDARTRGLASDATLRAA